jgi:hypothetical protein
MVVPVIAVLVLVVAVLAVIPVMGVTVPMLAAAVLLVLAAAVAAAHRLTSRVVAALVSLVKAQVVDPVAVVLAGKMPKLSVPSVPVNLVVVTVLLVVPVPLVRFGLFGPATFAHSRQPTRRICKWNSIFDLLTVNLLIIQSWVTIFAKRFQMLTHQICLRSLPNLKEFSLLPANMKLLWETRISLSAVL